MPEFKVIISDPRNGRARKVLIKGPQAQALIGRRIGDVIEGDVLGLRGIKLKITGGSARSGEPMLPTLPGRVRRRLLLSRPPGYRPEEEGARRRKLVHGNEIDESIVQINTVIVYPKGGGGNV